MLGGCDELFGFEGVSPRSDAAIVDAASDAPPAWSTPVPVTLDVPGGHFASDVSLTADETSLVYATTRDEQANWDVYTARLLSPTMGGARTPIAMTAVLESSPELSPDGATLYYLTYEATTNLGEINYTARTAAGWQAPTKPADLNTVAVDDRPGSPDASGTYMVIKRSTALQELRNADGTWTEIDTCGAINAILMNARNPHLSPDGLRLVFSAATESGAGRNDLYIARRAVLGEMWSAPELLSELSVSNINDTDPWMSADGTRIWFNRGQTVLFSEYR